jgi:methionine-rich copper-binding protein CopC
MPLSFAPVTTIAWRPARSLPSTVLPALLAAVLALLAPGLVLAHAELVSSDPQDGAVLETPPTSVTLTFSEGVVGKSSMQLIAPDGSTIGSTGPAADGDTSMSLGGLDLGPGPYTVQWTSVAADGDILRGKLAFTVTAASPTLPSPSPTPPASAEPSASPTPLTSVGTSATPTSPPTVAPSPSADTGTVTAAQGDVLLPILAALVIVGVVGVLVLRRNRAS